MTDAPDAYTRELTKALRPKYGRDYALLLAEEWMGTNTLDKHIARARREMGPGRWAALNAEWETNDGD